MGFGPLVLAGRLLVGVALLVSGARLLAYLPMVSGLLAGKGVRHARVVAAAGGVFEIVTGLAVILGVWLPFVAALAVFILAATLMVHDFWNEDGMQRFADINAAIANVIIIGALLALAGLSF